MPDAGLRLSIVVPTYNESGNVAELLRRIITTLGADGWELIFVDDDSPDHTAQRVRELARTDQRVRCVQRIGRRGLSSACIEGMLAAGAPVIAVMDADLQHDEAILPAMRDQIESGRAELVIGTRYAAGGSTGDWDQRRRWMSRVATRASHLVLKQPISDPMSGFFMLDRAVLDLVVRRLSAIGFKILMDIVASAPRPLRIAEVPFTFRDRFSGQSKLDSLVIWEYLMLLADKTVGRVIPVRFLAFSMIGGLGVFVHMAILAAGHRGAGLVFAAAQTAATGGAMLFNFWANNLLTYRDRRLRGAAWWRGLAAFVAVCSVGAVANIGIANFLFKEQTRWYLAALAGVVVGAVWNYAATSLYTWRTRS